MGELKNKVIEQTRAWIDESQSNSIPDLDYNYIYPITVYEAVRRSIDDTSTTLLDEIDAIYRELADKQDTISGGVPGTIMTWSGVRGQIGELDVAKVINTDPATMSNEKIPTEKAVATILASYAKLSEFANHANNNSIHVTDIERTKWNSMAPNSKLEAHLGNLVLHVTNDERKRWNNKADQGIIDEHIINTNNPHAVTAHQAGAYTREEIDTLFDNLRDGFFNHMNILWNRASCIAELVDYHPANWNPNYVLGFNQELPNIVDDGSTYFALRPATDYSANESNELIIYAKLPGLLWQEVGSREMNNGDMVIRFPDTGMFVWTAGRFLRIFTDSAGADIDEDATASKSWIPLFDSETGTLTFKIYEVGDTIPEPIKIVGEDGKSPVKGLDYEDGKDGIGVPVGGLTSEMLVKNSDDNYDTTWKSFSAMLADLAANGESIPDGLVKWDNIDGRPVWYNELGQNEDGFVTQKAVTDRFDADAAKINDILERITSDGGIVGTKEDLKDHMRDYNNPHRVSPAQIGAATLSQLLDHINNDTNPHRVTKAQLGLTNVDDTSDIDKPVSHATQVLIDDIKAKIAEINNSVGDFRYITQATWDNGRCEIVFTFNDDSSMRVTIPINDIFNNITFDPITKELVITLPDGSENRIDINGLIQNYFGSTSLTIKTTIDSDNIIKSDIIPESIGDDYLKTSLALKGSPTALTQPVSDRSTRLATTEYVAKQVIDNLISYEVDRGLSANMGRILNQKKLDREQVTDLFHELSITNIVDNLESTDPTSALSANMGRHLDAIKAPMQHTSQSGTTYGRATIGLFGHTRASEIDPLMDGTVFRGTDDGRYARADHRHPTDVTRAPVSFPDVKNNIYKLTGEPKADTAPNDSNDERLATTEWVRANAIGVNKGESSTSSSEAAKVATLRSTFTDPVVFMRQIGTTVAITFENEDLSNHNVITTLNVQDSGAAPILFAGAPLTNGMIGKNHTHMFVFDGENWRLINPVPGAGIGGPTGIVIGPGNADPDNEVVINKLTGYAGITMEGKGTVNENGEVSRVWITINYTPRPTDVELTLSDDENAWAVKMGDGTIINCSNPEIVECTRYSTIIEFTIEHWYPSNSPCQLVYHNNLAWINIKEIE